MGPHCSRRHRGISGELTAHWSRNARSRKSIGVRNSQHTGNGLVSPTHSEPELFSWLFQLASLVQPIMFLHHLHTSSRIAVFPASRWSYWHIQPNLRSHLCINKPSVFFTSGRPVVPHLLRVVMDTRLLGAPCFPKADKSKQKNVQGRVSFNGVSYALPCTLR